MPDIFIRNHDISRQSISGINREIAFIQWRDDIFDGFGIAVAIARSPFAQRENINPSASFSRTFLTSVQVDLPFIKVRNRGVRAGPTMIGKLALFRRKIIFRDRFFFHVTRITTRLDRAHKTDAEILSRKTTSDIRRRPQKRAEICNRSVPAGLAIYDTKRKIPATSSPDASRRADATGCHPEFPDPKHYIIECHLL